MDAERNVLRGSRETYINMKRLSIALLLSVFPLVSAFGQAKAPSAAPDLAGFFADDAALFMGIRDFPDMMSKYDRSPLRPFMESGALGDWMEGEDLSDEEREEIKQQFEKMKDVTQGGAAFVLTDMTPFITHLRERGQAGDFDLPDDVLDPNANPKDLDLGNIPKAQRRLTERAFAKHALFAVYTGEKQGAMHKLMLDIAESAEGDGDKGEDEPQTVKVIERNIKGHQVYTARRQNKKGKAKGEPMCWGFSEGVAVMGPNAQSVAAACKQIAAGGPENPLRASAEFNKASVRAEHADGMMYLNLKPMIVAADEELKKAELPEGSGLDADRISAALKLDTIDAASMFFRMEEEGLRLTMNYGFSENTRLAKVLMPHSEAAAKRPDFIPADMISVRSLRMSPRAFHDAAVDLAANINPQFGAVVPVMALQLKGMIGVDYRKHLLDNLGDSMIIAESFDGDQAGDPDNPMAGSGYLIGMEMKDKDGLLESLAKIRAEFGEDMIAERKIDGHTVYDIVPLKLQGVDVGFSMIGGYLVFCAGDTSFEKVLATHKKPETSIWNTARFKEMQGNLPEQAVSFGYVKVDSMFQQLKDLTGNLPADVPADQIPDFDKLSDLFGSAMTASTKEEGRMTTDMMLYYKEHKD